MKVLKKNILVLTIILCVFVGCSQGPNFTSEFTVVEKNTTSEGTIYYIDGQNTGVRGGAEWGEISFKADEDFACVGDILKLKGKTFVILNK